MEIFIGCAMFTIATMRNGFNFGYYVNGNLW